MRYIDVFNGDADGICSLVQLRRNEPRESELVTGVKREIALLKNVVKVSPRDKITVLDISFEKNANDVKRLLTSGAEIFYADHHNYGTLIDHENLSVYINNSASTCTSLIINKYLGGRYHEWAITAAFGDNIDDSAIQLAKMYGLNDSDISILKALGIFLNYNGYGDCVEDLFFHPKELYSLCADFDSPFDFLEKNQIVFGKLEKGYQKDLAMAQEINPFYQSSSVALIRLPDEKWAHRVSGVLANVLANRYPKLAHAVIINNDSGYYHVSIRAPLAIKNGADDVARQFTSGGGRKAASGINSLHKDCLSELINALEKQYSV